MNKQTIIDAGRFNRQLTIENEIETTDELGGFYTHYEAQDTVWAHICPVRAVNSNQADTTVMEVSHKITIRFRSGLMKDTRFVTGNRRFYIETVRDPDETRRYLECDCIERA